jgi:hypothetical protein
MLERGYRWELSDSQYAKLQKWQAEVIERAHGLDGICGDLAKSLTVSITFIGGKEFVTAEYFGEELDLTEREVLE